MNLKHYPIDSESFSTRDYGLQWGIVSMFSDFKSRGFRLSDSKIQTDGWRA